VTDPRLIPANGRVAATRLQGLVAAERFSDGERLRLSAPLADLCAQPGGRRERQLRYGEEVVAYETREGWSFVEAARDGYVGYVEATRLAPPLAATHVVSVPATHLYPAPDLKRRESCGLSFGSRLRIVGAEGGFFETDTGHFVPRPHVRPANRPFTDPATVAQLHFGAPYLWGGNSIWGVDCSGLVQAALLACAIPCPGDSDLQATLGEPLAEGEPPARGDLLFWKGHVAMAVDAETLIHANAFTMSVAYEGIEDAVARIAVSDGPVTGRRRVRPQAAAAPWIAPSEL
jgi:cell wall-associated NlpC family hydrolase